MPQLRAAPKVSTVLQEQQPCTQLSMSAGNQQIPCVMRSGYPLNRCRMLLAEGHWSA